VTGFALTTALAGTLLGSAAPAQAQFLDFLFQRSYRQQPSYYAPPDDYDRPRTRDSSRERDAVKKEAKKQAAPKNPLVLVVSIARQRVTVFSNGIEIAQAPVSTGVPGHPTPTGVFSVIQKQLYHESNLYSAAPMPYMQRITWSGIALHAGPLPGYPASHGCIRLPRDFAVKLYTMTKTGARVVITRDEAAPSEIENAALFQPKPAEEKKPQASVATVAIEMAAASKTEGPQSDVTASVNVAPVVNGVPTPETASPASTEPKRKGNVSVFISRKQAKLYVRQGMAPLFEMPITIKDADKAIGTHVFTATDLKDDGKAMRWTALSIPSANPRGKTEILRDERKSRRAHRETREVTPPPAPVGPGAKEALERIDIPAETRERISALLTPGASLIISDNALSDETGSDTDFVVLTP